jgi:asparagine synthase (glutamine-hydrolysing)
MCGIAGYLGHPAGTDGARALLARMASALAHRGPDGSGVHVGRGAGLAHTRLAIIDREGGEQPMPDATGDTWLAFNGEIFNFIELRAALEARGHVFRTRSDTEVVLHLYARHGDRFVEHLNGQFAIALWDARRRRLMLARDRLGIRPLYHTRAGGCLWFASEPAALFAARPELRRLDPMGIAQAFTLWAPLDPDTVWQGIASLPPGHLLTVEADGRQALTRYWDWSFPDAGAAPAWPSIEAAAEELRARLADAVRLQLRADVPVGAYLSGGLDSSAIAALVRASEGAQLRTFSLAFDEAEFDERPHQQAMARHLGTAHTTLAIGTHAIGEAFPRLVRHAGAPLLRTAAVPMMLLADEVRRQGYRVVLTGEGADEVFAGYDLFREAAIRRFCARQPTSQWRHLLFARLYGYLAHSPAASPAMAAAFFARGDDAGDPVFAHRPRWATSARAVSFLAPALRAQATAADAVACVEARLPADARRWAPLARDQYVEAKTLMAGYLLASQGDRAAMAGSIEARFPFLDHTLVEFANRLPPRWKLRGLEEKHILRRAVADLLPPGILSRTKQPFRAPDSRAFFVDGRPLDYVEALFDASHLQATGLFDVAATTRLYAKARAGQVRGFADNQAFVGVLSTLLLAGPAPAHAETAVAADRVACSVEASPA